MFFLIYASLSEIPGTRILAWLNPSRFSTFYSFNTWKVFIFVFRSKLFNFLQVSQNCVLWKKQTIPNIFVGKGEHIFKYKCGVYAQTLWESNSMEFLRIYMAYSQHLPTALPPGSLVEMYLEMLEIMFPIKIMNLVTSPMDSVQIMKIQTCTQS